MIPNSAEYGPFGRPIATASLQPQIQIHTAGRVDQLWTKADVAKKGEGPVIHCLWPGSVDPDYVQEN